MRYQGGKTRVAKDIAEIILSNRGNRREYIEPFLGGAAVFTRVAPHFEWAVGTDAMPDVILMWQAAAKLGWVPPTTVTEADYAAAKADPEPSALRGFIGFGCSFGGKWFGGYAREGAAKGHNPNLNIAAGASRSVVARAATMRRAVLRHADYRNVWYPADMSAMVIYADPPYANTTAYAGAGQFDSAEFWTHAQTWAARGAQVYVSEYTAPAGWRAIWSKERHVSTALNNTGHRATEKLWVPET